ncbi:MAG: hypothetical protein Q9160_003677 [Pyrenula sp. 1 TL-2023]
MNESLLSEVDGGPLPLSKQANDLWHDIIKPGLQRHSESHAVIALQQPSDHLSHLLDHSSLTQDGKDRKHLCWTFKQLDAASNCVASQLLASGIKRGAAICPFTYSCVEWAILLWASAKLGLVFAPLDPASLKREEEARYLLDLLKPTVIVVQSSEDAKDFDALNISVQPMLKLVLNEKAETLKHWSVMGDTFKNDLSGRLRLSAQCVLRGNDVAAIMFTSGTTGKPKGCPQTHSSLGAYVLPPGTPRSPTSKSKSIVLSASFRILHLLHPLTVWSVGGSIVLPAPRFSPTATLHALLTEQCTHLQLVPSQVETFRRLLSSKPIAEQEAAKGVLDVLTIGGDAVSRSQLDLAASLFRPRIACKNSFGMTEGCGALSHPIYEPPIFHAGIPIAGRVTPGHRIRICDPTSYSSPPSENYPTRRKPPTIVPLLTPGELHVAGPCIIPHYLPTSLPANTSRFLTDSDIHGNTIQWYITGDRAIMSPSSSSSSSSPSLNITILGRYKDVISRSAIMTSPSVIETCLLADAADPAAVVADVIAIGIPSATHGEVPVAVVKTANANVNVNVNVNAKVEVEVTTTNETTGAVVGVAAPADGEPRLEKLKERLLEKARRELTEDAAPERVVLLWEDLGWEDWPVDADSGKVQKGRVRGAVVGFLEREGRGAR